jgi:hypothetical protein
MKITVLTYLDSDDENSKDYDPVVPQVARALRKLGHRVSVLGAHGDVKRLIGGLSRRRPDLGEEGVCAVEQSRRDEHQNRRGDRGRYEGREPHGSAPQQSGRAHCERQQQESEADRRRP